MKELQSVALGLVVVFVDVGDPDWVADPLGWLLVLVGIAASKDRLTDYGYLQVTAWVCLGLSVVTWPPNSVPTLDATLEWLFRLPTLAFGFMLADSLTDVTVPDLAKRFRMITWLFALVTVLPMFPLILDWEWLAMPSLVLTILAYAVLVLSLFSAADEDAVLAPGQESDDHLGTDGAGSGAGAEEGKHKA